jgi:glycosyltransferase involved in cell wall biosynthesis
VIDVAAAARRFDADVIEGCGEKMSVLSGWAARAARLGSVYSLQDRPRRSLGAAAVQLAAMSGRHDAVIVPSRWMAREFRTRLGLRAMVVPNTVVLEDLPRSPADVRGEAGWAADSVVVGLFARLVAWKGAEVFLGAAARVADAHPRARFLIAGGTLYGEEPDFPGRLRRLARELGMAERVHFTGHREDVLAVMHGCDVICHCSLEPEPFGMVVIEAMAIGKPVLASRAGGPEEIVEHGRSGILVDPGDEQALAGEIAALLADPARRRALGDAGRDRARRAFSSEVTGERLAGLYRGVAAGRPG